MPKVSVIMAVYNSGSSLNNSVPSVLNQSFLDFEFIIINDGSTDSSFEILKTYKDDRIIIINQKNGGPAKARNNGLSIAKGEYVMFIDSDDAFDSNIIEMMVCNIEKNRRDWVICGYHKKYNNVEINVCPEERTYCTKKEILENLNTFVSISSGNDVPPLFNSLWNKIYRKKIIEQYNLKMPEHIRMGEDYQFNIQYLKFCQSLQFLGQNLYSYTISEKCLSTTFKENEFQMQKSNVRALEEFCEENNLEDINCSFQYIVAAYSCLVNLFLPDNPHTRSENRKAIKEIIESKEVKKVIREYKPRGLQQIVPLAILKSGNITIISITSYLLFKIRNR